MWDNWRNYNRRAFFELGCFSHSFRVLFPGAQLNKTCVYMCTHMHTYTYIHISSSSVHWEGLIAVTLQEQCPYLTPTFCLSNFTLNLEEMEYLEKWWIQGLGKIKYKMSLEHLSETKISKYSKWRDIPKEHSNQLEGIPLKNLSINMNSAGNKTSE